MRTAEYWIERLDLQPHPEGGYFRETYRSPEAVQGQHLPGRFGGDRAFSTAIYFLITRDAFSAFHCLRSDEAWHFYDGGTALLHCLHEKDGYQAARLGLAADQDALPQYVVPAGCWFAVEVEAPATYALFGCTVAPGFDFADITLADADALIREFPEQTALIRRLTR